MLQKKALRTQMREIRKSCSNRPDKDKLLFKKIISSSLYRDAECILSYVSYGTEADTIQLLSHALENGKLVYVPRCILNTNQMQFFRIDSLSDLHPDQFGIPAPAADMQRVFHSCSSAICFVPGLAFSTAGKRLGYGRGYYDTFLEKIDVCTIGLCYDFQLLSDVPTKERDKLMRFICTDQDFWDCRSSQKILPFTPERKL